LKQVRRLRNCQEQHHYEQWCNGGYVPGYP
jgi:hypothetical protein